MSFDLSFGGVHLGRGARTRTSDAATRVPDADPVRIGILGDFGGKPSSDGSWPVLRVDRDRFDEVMDQRGVSLRLILPSAWESLELRFRSLDDFHPDRLMDQVPWLSELKATRQGLRNPFTFDKTAEKLSPPAPAEFPVKTSPGTALPLPLAEQDPQTLLDQILGQTSSANSPAPRDSWTGFLHKLIAPYLIEPDDPKQVDLISSVEAAISDLLRQILHHPEFQALEANWRALWWVVRGLETGSSVVVDLIDVPRSTLEADLVSTHDLQESHAFQQLAKPILNHDDGLCWSLLVGAFTILPTLPDIVLLWKLGQLARAVSARMVLEASPRLAGCPDATSHDDRLSNPRSDVLEAWTDLRASDDAEYLALALPPWVARLPYGPDRDPIETFAFEEAPNPLSDSSLLWANSAFAVARILGESLVTGDRGWPDLEDAVLVIHDHDGQTVSRPPTRALFSQTAFDRLVENGFSPLIHPAGTDRIQLPALISIAEAPSPLFR